MISLKAGYFQDEVNELLLRHTSAKSVKEALNSISGFTLKNPPDLSNINTAPPLIKVAWNIINRGNHTRSSIKLSEYLLREAFKEEMNFQDENGDFRVQLPCLESVDAVKLDELLLNLPKISEVEATEYGIAVFRLSKIIRISVKFAQIQKTIMLCLLANPEPLSFKIRGVSDKTSQILIEDLNELFANLNILISKGEVPIPLIGLKDTVKTIKICADGVGEDDILIKSGFDENLKVDFNVLTDRSVSYKTIGSIIGEEIYRGSEKVQNQRFMYKEEGVEGALKYFLKNIFRKSSFRPGQEGIICRALVCKDVVGLLPTGGGKSLTFQLCALLHPGVTLVVDPINSLMKDQFDKLLENGFSRVNYINSFDDKNQRRVKLAELYRGNYQILFISPERLQIEEFRNSLLRCKYNDVYFSYAVIDEAHCVSEWGHDFRHVYLNLAENLKRYCIIKEGVICLFALTATASFDVLADVQRELKLEDDSVVSLPPEAIDRKELNFLVLKMDKKIRGGLEHWEREGEIAVQKYPRLRKLLKNMPSRIAKLNRRLSLDIKSSSFYKINEEGIYSNGGIIFCPTKSDIVPNGVLHVQNGSNGLEGLSELKFLKIGTFFAADDDDSIKKAIIEGGANESLKNQKEFINNKTNLMIATKAFGMGIDKPNIRFTVHYSLPNSLESFYQEAGRAGRDRQSALSTILFHPLDTEMNLDFFRSGFKGPQREQEIIDELLNEVRYEDLFFFKVYSRILKDKYLDVKSVNLVRERYIYINGLYDKDSNKNVKIGLLDLRNNLTNYPNTNLNYNREDAEDILRDARQILREKCPEGNYLEWFRKKSDSGIKTLIDKGSEENHTQLVGFNNDIIGLMTQKIKCQNGYEGFKDFIISAAYRFSYSPEKFIENLKGKYKSAIYHKNINGPGKLEIEEDTEKYIKDNFYKIRNVGDTQRAIYRMNLLGIIDDYVIDYASRIIEVRFRAKSEAEYLTNFDAYLGRYLGIEGTKVWLVRVNSIERESILERVMSTLIKFTEGEIAKKRKRSIIYMKELCEIFLEEGEDEFRERMVRYFTSKYARNDYLPYDTENGTKQNIAIITKYLDYIENPPDGLGGPIDNVKHLRGACDNIRINAKDENASINVLSAFCYFALELNPEDTIEATLRNRNIVEAIRLYKAGFIYLLRDQDWKEVVDALHLFNLRVLDFNQNITLIMNKLATALIVNRTNYKLKDFLQKIN